MVWFVITSVTSQLQQGRLRIWEFERISDTNYYRRDNKAVLEAARLLTAIMPVPRGVASIVTRLPPGTRNTQAASRWFLVIGADGV